MSEIPKVSFFNKDGSLLSLTAPDDTCVLTPWILDDLDMFWDLFSSARPQLVKKFWWAPSLSKGSSELWLDSRSKAWTDGFEYDFKISVPDKDGVLQPAGHVSIGWLDWKHRRAVIGFWLAPDFQGRGLCSPVLRLVASFAFQCLGLSRIELTTAADNVSAQRCFVSAGAFHEGVLRNRFIRAGSLADGVVFSFIPSDILE